MFARGILQVLVGEPKKKIKKEVPIGRLEEQDAFLKSHAEETYLFVLKGGLIDMVSP